MRSCAEGSTNDVDRGGACQRTATGRHRALRNFCPCISLSLWVGQMVRPASTIGPIGLVSQVTMVLADQLVPARDVAGVCYNGLSMDLAATRYFSLFLEGEALSVSKKAVVLLSGGLDSTTVLAIAHHEGYELHTLSFEYGQRHLREVEAARAVAQHYGVVQQKTVAIDLRAFGGSSLTTDEAVPHSRSADEMTASIPSTYVPARNTIFLSFALAYAEVNKANDIFLGINAIDYSGYPDCRPEYLEAYERMANLATRASTQDGRVMHFHAPLLHLSKAEIVRKGDELGVPYELTWSCYEGGERACGTCDSCLLRIAGFAEAGRSDPLSYEVRV